MLNVVEENSMDQDVRTIIKEELGDFAIMVNKGFESLRTEMQSEFQSVRTEMQDEFQSVRTEMQDEFQNVRSEMATLQTTVNRIDTRTQNQMDAVYEDTGALKNDMKEAQEDIVSIKAHVGMTA